MISENQFLKNLEKDKPKNIDRVIGILWYYQTITNATQKTVAELCDVIEKNGFAVQNQSRIKISLNKDKRITKNKLEYAISAKYYESLSSSFSKYLNHTPLLTIAGLLDEGMFVKSRGYIINTVKQLNQSYDYGLYDCCAVMCRRLLETLIIEVYEEWKISTEIKDSDNNYLMFSGLLSCVENQNHFHIGRNALKGLKDFKTIGDLSAHNRRFNARRSDIEKIQIGIRQATEELLHLANLGV